jgi:HK97 family phage prohead protease
MIEGYAALFNVLDDGGDIILKGAFTKTLSDMATADGTRVAFCYQHQLNDPIGKIVDLKEDDKGLYFKCRVSDAEPEVKIKIKEKILNEMSFGFDTIQSEKDVRNNKDVRLLKELQLYELSPVTLGMDKYAGLSQTKAALGIESIEDAFDKLIFNTRNREQRYELLMLKKIALAEIASAHKAVNPKNDTLPNRMEEPLEVATLLVTHFKNLVSKDYGRETNKGPN